MKFHEQQKQDLAELQQLLESVISTHECCENATDEINIGRAWVLHDIALSNYHNKLKGMNIDTLIHRAQSSRNSTKSVSHV